MYIDKEETLCQKNCKLKKLKNVRKRIWKFRDSQVAVGMIAKHGMEIRQHLNVSIHIQRMITGSYNILWIRTI